MSDEEDESSVPPKWQALVDASMTRMLEWELPRTERFLYGWLVELTFKRRRFAVCVPTQGHFCRLTGFDERAISFAIAGLKRCTLLDVSGTRNGPKWYRLLPNGRLIEPEKIIDPGELRSALAEIEQLNGAAWPGCKPGDQRRLNLVTLEERLAEEQAAGSRELAVDHARLLRADDLSKNERSLPAIFPKTKDGPVRESHPVHTNARAERLDVLTRGPLTSRRLDVRSGEGGNADPETMEFALSLVREVVPAEDFEPWRRKWEARVGLRGSKDPALQPQPRLIIEAAAEVKRDLLEGRPVTNPGGSILDRVRRWLGPRGNTFRTFSL